MNRWPAGRDGSRGQWGGKVTEVGEDRGGSMDPCLAPAATGWIENGGWSLETLKKSYDETAARPDSFDGYAAARGESK